jgi:hypothetical protein
MLPSFVLLWILPIAYTPLINQLHEQLRRYKAAPLGIVGSSGLSSDDLVERVFILSKRCEQC